MTPNFSPAGRAAWLYRGLVALFLVGLAVLILFRKPADWAKVYVAAAERLRAGLDIYEWNTTSYVYPPLGAWLAVAYRALCPIAPHESPARPSIPSPSSASTARSGWSPGPARESAPGPLGSWTPSAQPSSSPPGARSA